MRPLLKSFFPLFILLFFASCAGNLYRPSVAYAPQFKEKDEVEIGASAGLGSGGQIQAGWAATNHFGLQVQANATGKNTANILGGPSWRKVYPMKNEVYFVSTFSAGYSGGINQREKSRVTGTAVTSGVEAQPGYIVYNTDARWHGAFAQYSFGIWGQDAACLYGGMRMQWLNCSSFHYSSTFYATRPDKPGFFLPAFTRTVDPSNGFTMLVEDFVGVRIGKKQLKFLFQVQWRYQYTGENLNDHWGKVSVGEGVIGFEYRFNKAKPAVNFN